MIQWDSFDCRVDTYDPGWTNQGSSLDFSQRNSFPLDKELWGCDPRDASELEKNRERQVGADWSSSERWSDCSEADFLDPTDEKVCLVPGLLHFNYVDACIHTLLMVRVNSHFVLEGISLPILSVYGIQVKQAPPWL